ncbi:MAG: hypothetical protein QXU67_04705 [Candidatus Bathyarchaeia archaeon]
MHIHEYMFAAFAIISILLASSLMLTISSEPLKVVSERENLKAIAQSILTQIILSPGDPINWGSNTAINGSNLKSFGLAYQSRTTKEAYVLDPDKISRLNVANPFYISPLQVRDLLGLSAEYGFTIEVLPALDINVSMRELGKYEVSVRSTYDGMPIQNVNITARIYYLEYDGRIHALPEDSSKYNVTGYDGKCNISFGELSGDLSAVAIFIINYHSVRTVKVIGHNIKWAYLTGRVLSLNFTALEVIAHIKGERYEIEEINSEVGFMDEGLYALGYIEPKLVAVLAVVEESGSGEKSIVLAARDMSLTYGTVSLLSASLPLGFVIEKVVMVDEFSYILRLYVWRLVW